MARTDSKEKRAAREETPGRILNIPGVVGEPVWRELADEAETYLELYRSLSKESLDSRDREALEDKMILSLGHLATHSRVLYRSVDKAIETHFSEELESENFAQEAFEEVSEGEVHELLRVGLSAQKSLISFWNYLNKATVTHGKEIRVKKLELEKIIASKRRQAGKQKEIIRVLDSIAAVVEQHVSEISVKLPAYRRDVGRYVGAYSNFVFWLPSTDHGEQVHIEELHAVIVDFENTLQELVSSLLDYINSVQSIAGSALEHYNHIRLNAACTKLASKLIGILDTVRGLDTFTENVLTKLNAGSQ